MVQTSIVMLLKTCWMKRSLPLFLFQARGSRKSSFGEALFRPLALADRPICQLFTPTALWGGENGGDPVPEPEPVPALVLGPVEGEGGPTCPPRLLAGATKIATIFFFLIKYNFKIYLFTVNLLKN